MAVSVEVARVLTPRGRIAVFDKFLPDGVRPSFWRRIVSAVACVIATALNRQLGRLARAAGLVAVASEPVALGGMLITARGEADSGAALASDIT